MIIVCRGTYSEPSNEYWLGVWVEPVYEDGKPTGAYTRVCQRIGNSAQDAHENIAMFCGSRPAYFYPSNGPTIAQIVERLSSCPNK